MAELWEVAQDTYYAKNPATAEGINLDGAVQYGGIRRATNRYSYYKLHCKGEDGTVVRNKLRKFRLLRRKAVSIKELKSKVIDIKSKGEERE